MLLDRMSGSGFVGFTILAAVRRADEGAVRSWLLNGDPSFVVHPESGYSLIMFATFLSARRAGVLEILRLLLAAGGDATATTRSDEADGEFAAGKTALYYAAADRNLEALELLLSRGGRAALARGKSALAAVCGPRMRDPEVLAYASWPRLWEPDDSRDATCMDLLLAGGADVDAKDGGAAPLHLAAKAKRFDLVAWQGRPGGLRCHFSFGCSRSVVSMRSSALRERDER